VRVSRSSHRSTARWVAFGGTSYRASPEEIRIFSRHFRPADAEIRRPVLPQSFVPSFTPSTGRRRAGCFDRVGFPISRPRLLRSFRLALDGHSGQVSALAASRSFVATIRAATSHGGCLNSVNCSWNLLESAVSGISAARQFGINIGLNQTAWTDYAEVVKILVNCRNSIAGRAAGPGRHGKTDVTPRTPVYVTLLNAERR